MATAERGLHGRGPTGHRALGRACGSVDDATEQRVGSADNTAAASPSPPGCAGHGRASERAGRSVAAGWARGSPHPGRPWSQDRLCCPRWPRCG